MKRIIRFVASLMSAIFLVSLATVQVMAASDTTGPDVGVQAYLTGTANQIVVVWAAHDPSGVHRFDLEVTNFTALYDRKLVTGTQELYYVFTGGPGHRYQFKVTAYDRLGNKRTAYTSSITVPDKHVDVTGPDVGASAALTGRPNQIIIGWAAYDPSGVDRFDLEVTDFTAIYDRKLVIGTRESYYFFTGTPGHRYQFKVIAYDSLGNKQTAYTTTITLPR